MADIEIDDEIMNELGNAVHDVLHGHGLCAETGFVIFLTAMESAHVSVLTDLSDETVDALLSEHLMRSGRNCGRPN